MVVALKEIPVGKHGKIVDYKGGISFKLRLNQMGFHKGDMVRIKRNSIFSGPVLVEVMGREIAVGRGIAEKVMVEVDE